MQELHDNQILPPQKLPFSPWSNGNLDFIKLADINKNE